MKLYRVNVKGCEPKKCEDLGHGRRGIKMVGMRVEGESSGVPSMRIFFFKDIWK